VTDFPQAGFGQAIVLPKSAAGTDNRLLQWGQWTRKEFWADILGRLMTLFRSTPDYHIALRTDGKGPAGLRKTFLPIADLAHQPRVWISDVDNSVTGTRRVDLPPQAT